MSKNLICFHLPNKFSSQNICYSSFVFTSYLFFANCVEDYCWSSGVPARREPGDILQPTSYCWFVVLCCQDTELILGNTGWTFSHFFCSLSMF